MKNAISNIGYLLKQIWGMDKILYVVQLMILMITVSSRLIYVWFPKLIIDSLEEKNYEQALLVVVVLCLCVLGANSLLIILETLNKLRQDKVKAMINEQLARKSFRLPYEKFEEHKTREEYLLAIRCVQEDMIESIFKKTITILETIITICGLMYIIVYIPWGIGVLLLVGSIIQCACAVVRMKYNFKSYQDQNEVEIGMLYARGRLVGKSFAKEVRLFGMYQFVTDIGTFYINQLAQIQKERAKHNFSTLWWSFLVGSVQSLVVYMFVTYKCYSGIISIGEFSMIISGMLLFVSMMNQLGMTFIGIGEQCQYIEAVKSFLEKAEDRTKDKLKIPQSDSETVPNISFSKVSFSYPGSTHDAIHNLSLNLKMGKKYGVVGLNGSGKTTFISLLMGLYHSYTGEISINGVSTKELLYEELQAYFAPVLQSFGTYAYTVGENIALSETVDVQRINQLLNQVGMKERIDGLKEGIHTYITEEYNDAGTDFSGGERQKLAMARALYRDAPIFVLDEPTAALSPTSEYEFYQMFNRLMNNKTVFYISHRLASCRMCDEILVFEKGTVVEQGSHEVLMAKRGLYAELFQMQAEQFEV